MSLGLKNISLTWKIVGVFAGTIIFLGLAIVGSVYYLTGQALQEQIEKRTSSLALNLSDAAAGHVLAKNRLDLHALVSKYVRLDGVAYAFIEGGNGEILAHSFATFPRDLWRPLTFDERREEHRRISLVDGKKTYETRVPILEGQAGAAYVALWGDGVEEEIYRALMPIVGLVTVVLLVGTVVAALLARSIIRPIIGLTTLADKMSRGDLETPIEIESADEIGKLAHSLERMRASLKSAMAHLNRRTNAHELDVNNAASEPRSKVKML